MVPSAKGVRNEAPKASKGWHVATGRGPVNFAYKILQFGAYL